MLSGSKGAGPSFVGTMERSKNGNNDEKPCETLAAELFPPKIRPAFSHTAVACTLIVSAHTNSARCTLRRFSFPTRRARTEKIPVRARRQSTAATKRHGARRKRARASLTLGGPACRQFAGFTRSNERVQTHGKA